MKLTTFGPSWTLCCLSASLAVCTVTQAQAATFGRQQGAITFEIPGPAFYPGASLSLDSAALRLDLSNGYGGVESPLPNLAPGGFVAFLNQAKVSVEAKGGPDAVLTEAM